MQQIKCRVKDNTVIIPKYQTEGAAGMDLHAHSFSFHMSPNEDMELPYMLHPWQRILIKTGLSIELPKNYEAQIRPRSGLALKHGISLVNTPGTIDCDYRGEIGVILINHGIGGFLINKGDRIAQMVFNEVKQLELVSDTELSETERGEGAYSSTGTK